MVQNFMKVPESPGFLEIVNKVLLALVINLSLTFAMWVAMRSYYYSREHLFLHVFSIFCLNSRMENIGISYYSVLP